MIISESTKKEGKGMWISKRRYEYLISRIEKCERKLQTQKEENTLEIRNMAKKILEQPQKLYEEIRSAEKMINS